MPTTTSSYSTVDFHRGEVLWSLANTYPNLMLTIVEAIQNGIDAEADRIMVCIDLKARNVTIVDNGMGVTRERFELGLASVGKGVKEKDKLGRFGRGLIAPLNKCASFAFVSAPVGTGTVLRWRFVGTEIRKQHRELHIPSDKLSALPKLSKLFESDASGTFNITWRTMVALKGVTKDKVVSLVDLDELESQIRQKLGAAMRRKNVLVRVVLSDENGRKQSRDVDPVHYSGEMLPVVSYDASKAGEAGEVIFELYRAPKRGGKRQGEVVVMELDGNYPVTMKEFTRQARGGEWREIVNPVFEVLNSGYFEGIIRCKNIELAPERTKFVYNDALKALYLLLSTWFDEHGREAYEDERVQNREQRYQDLGVKSQQHLRDVLRQPQFQRLWEGLTSVVETGRLGSDHLDPENGTPDGIEDESSIRSGQGTDRGKNTGGRTTCGKPGERTPRDRPGDVPTGAYGPSGQRRQLVKGDSQGLWFEYSRMDGSSRLWEFDFNRGVLTLNVRHPIWVQLDETNGKHTARNDKWVMQLQEWLALEILVLLMDFRTSEALDEWRHLVDTKVRPYVELTILPQRP